MQRAPWFILLVVTGVVTASPGEAGDWTLSLRGGLGWPTDGGRQSPSALSLAAGAAYRVDGPISLFGSLGRLAPGDVRTVGPCTSGYDGFNIACANSRLSGDLVPFTIGIQLGGIGPRRQPAPALSVGPTVLYGRWRLETRSTDAGPATSLSFQRILLGAEASLMFPVMLTERLAAEIGFQYVYTGNVEGPGETGTVSGFRQVLVVGGVSCRLGATGQ